MPTTTSNGRTFDARPDRIDLRDRQYQPKLVNLPDQHPAPDFIAQNLPGYAAALVLDQGKEGACTGFGLAAVVNYLKWKKNKYSLEGIAPASPRMLYHMARLYDEWPGEDYEGSSCRGAMKGWSRHGVCSEALWPYRGPGGTPAFVPPKPGWDGEAARSPLGAYYRIDKACIADIQSAVVEVGAVYCSADVHKGWFFKKTDAPAIIPWNGEKPVGGHAFAIIGYTEDGFIIQNSWGSANWGYQGFAILGYEDWVANGTDAWVAALGAPMCVAASEAVSPRANARPLQPAGLASASQPGKAGVAKAVKPLEEAQAYLHSIVLGNNGLPINRLLTAENAAGAVRRAARDEPADWLSAQPGGAPPKVAVYAHGGLNSEEDSVCRIQMLAPYFLANGIYPIFVTWKTGALECIGDMLDDAAREIFQTKPSMRDEGMWQAIEDAVAEARDRTIEVACETLLVKPIWSEMKQNAAAAALPEAGAALLAGHLLALKDRFPALELHLAGHSAGSIFLGHLLPLLGGGLSVATLSLFAPACTVPFAVERYGAALAAGTLQAKAAHVDAMTDERERADTVGPYGKSLLYLVSRALETRHKMPLLGMEWAWRPFSPDGPWNDEPETRRALEEWAKRSAGMGLRLHDKSREYVSTGTGQIRLAHGSFDNDVDVVSRMLERMRGDALTAPVENLAY